MHVETIRHYCLQKPGVTEELPFGPETLVFKVMGKVFALLPLDEPVLSMNLKCDPELAHELREHYSGVRPGYHMNKTHWNTVVADGSFAEQQLLAWIDHSYNLVANKLPKNLKNTLNQLP